jgi:hypothetical protein
MKEERVAVGEAKQKQTNKQKKKWRGGNQEVMEGWKVSAWTNKDR